MKIARCSFVVTLTLALAVVAGGGNDVPFVPTPTEVVDKMLEMAEVKAGDVVYDLGCGDARIVIAAVQKGAARGVCVEINRELIERGKANAKQAGVADRVIFIEGDLFKVPFKDATVVTLYLLRSINKRLRPRLQAELAPGTRIVAHDFDLGDEWKPEQTAVVHTGRPHMVYRWTIAPPSTAPRPEHVERKTR